MADILFYHLTQSKLEDALPLLLEKTLERGWRAVLQCGSEERAGTLNEHLWTYRDESFLPHGLAGTQDEALQPVVIATTDTNPNGATVRFLVDRAVPGDLGAYERVVLMFDGYDPPDVEAARGHWKRFKADGHSVTYWQQDEAGRWAKKV